MSWTAGSTGQWRLSNLCASVRGLHVIYDRSVAYHRLSYGGGNSSLHLHLPLYSYCFFTLSLLFLLFSTLAFYYYYFFIPSVSMIPRDFGKKLSKIRKVGVTITPGSPRGWRTRAVKCCCNAASEQKCAGIKRPSPAHRQNTGWFSSPKQKENQRPTHW